MTFLYHSRVSGNQEWNLDAAGVYSKFYIYNGLYVYFHGKHSWAILPTPENKNYSL